MDGPLAQIEPDPFHLEVIRHTAALHDIGEIEHPEALIRHGSVVGDIASSTGKTAEDRAKERAIYKDVIDSIFDKEYSDEFRDAMVKTVSHETEGETPLFTKYHGILEFAHHLNSAQTGELVGKRAAEVAVASVDHANFMNVLAEQSEKTLARKFEEVFEHSPELKTLLGATAHTALYNLHREAHNRDEDPSWLNWRASKKVVAAYGEYIAEEF